MKCAITMHAYINICVFDAQSQTTNVIALSLFSQCLTLITVVIVCFRQGFVYALRIERDLLTQDIFLAISFISKITQVSLVSGLFFKERLRFGTQIYMRRCKLTVKRVHVFHILQKFFF